MSTGMGPGPITWQELRAWQDGTGVELQPWEARLLINLSREFAGESVAALQADRPAPYQAQPGDGRRAQIAKNLSVQMRAIAAAQRETSHKRKKPKA